MIEKSKAYTVITGASSGIGYETARAFAARGKNLIIIARRRHRLKMLQDELLRHHPDLKVVVHEADISVLGQAHQLYDDLKQYPLETWVNNAGFGNYASVAQQELEKITTMVQLNIEALTILSSLFVREYCDVAGTQLINVSSAGGYTIVPNAVTYCAAKFYVSAFTEGLAHELQEAQEPMQAKVLAPAATQTEFGCVANGVCEYDYDVSFSRYHTSRQMAGFLLELYDSDRVVGVVDRETFQFKLCGPLFSYAGSSASNQQFMDKNIK